MEKEALKKGLCSTLCPYYKPSKDEELACKGFLVIERLIRKGKKLPFKKSGRQFDSAVEESLVRYLCSVCPFYDRDCDFFSKGEDSQPCGGFIALEYLIKERIVTVDDVKDIR